MRWIAACLLLALAAAGCTSRRTVVVENRSGGPVSVLLEERHPSYRDYIGDPYHLPAGQKQGFWYDADFTNDLVISKDGKEVARHRLKSEEQPPIVHQ